MKHKIVIWVIGITIIFSGLTSTLTAISWNASANATSRADAAVYSLDIYKEGMNRDIKYIHTALSEVRVDIKEIKTGIDRLRSNPPQSP